MKLFINEIVNSIYYKNIKSTDGSWSMMDAEILDMIITNKKVIGKPIYEISPTEDYIIIATYKEGKLNIPQQDDILTKGEKISILVKRNALKKTEKKFE